MSRKRHYSNTHSQAFEWTGTIQIKAGAITGTTSVHLSLGDLPDTLKDLVGHWMGYDLRLHPEPMTMGEGKENDDWRDNLALLLKLFEAEIEKGLTSGINKTIAAALKRFPAESEKAGLSADNPYYPRPRPGRKPGSTESPTRTAAKVRRRIAQMEEAGKRLARHKGTSWSWSAIAREMNLSRQSLLAYARKHPEVRRRGEEMLRAHGVNF